MDAIVIFDGVCNFCNATVTFLLKRDRHGRLKFASNQSEAGAELLRRHRIDPENVTTIWFVEGGAISSKSTAVLRIARRLGWPWKLAYGFMAIPRPIRDAVYGLIARNRYRWFGKTEACRLPTPAERARFL